MYDAGVLSREGRAFVAYFEETTRIGGDAQGREQLGHQRGPEDAERRKAAIANFPISAVALGELIQEVRTSGLNMQRAREVYAAMLDGGESARAAIARLGFQVVADEARLPSSCAGPWPPIPRRWPISRTAS